MKKVLSISGLLTGSIILFYFLGPRPDDPNINKTYKFDLPTNLYDLEQIVENRETRIEGIKKGNEAQFIWADSLRTVTPYAFVYLHGFSSSHEEGAPVHENIAKTYKANLFKARLASHGLDLGDETLLDFNANDYIESAEEALAIGRKLGKKVILIATSAGGAQALHLASKHQDIAGIVLYSPCISIYDETARFLDMPWGLQIANAVQGKPFNDIIPKNKTQPLFWNMHYRLEALVELQNFLSNTMTKDVFKNVNCPLFMGYYYENETLQDNVVSVSAMLEMYENVASEKKQKQAFPATKNHVLASHVLSEDWKTVQAESGKFLDEIIAMKD